tara:strand:+ start:56 stop:571 length:516 start_codon:yes stop_codon:yes gene_type:complete
MTEFRKEKEAESTKGISKKIGMVQSFAMALASRGLNSKKINTATKQLRVLSCFGNKDSGGILPPCDHLRNSETEGKHFCGACGCGDREQTWLISESDKYSKLDYPKVACPLHMPGFTNYTTSQPDESESPITRKYYIEQIDYSILEKVKVVVSEAPPEPPKEEASEEEQPK